MKRKPSAKTVEGFFICSMKISEWALKLKDGVSGGLTRMGHLSDKMSRRFTRMQGKFKSFTQQAKKNLRDLSDEIPVLGRVGRALSNPMAMAGIAITLTAGLFVKATNEAKAFENQFLELKQLNLDKPQAELTRLNKKVLSVSWSTGMLAKDTAKAYFDIQSATGLYGGQVDAIVEKTAFFARATKTNFDSSIQSVGKAINAFGLDANKMDAFFASSFKTVQVGITTFDQLAQVQTDYAGAAAAANQTVDDSNKLFAAFTQTAKSQREAGTLTKQTFNDLTRKSTIDGFKRLGVSLFDNAGAMKSLDTITRETVPKLKALTDLEFSKLKEEIGGSEGIRALMDRMKGSGDSLIQTFDTFDRTEFDLDAALKNANGDLTIMSDILNNKINTILVRIGQSTMPSIVRGTSAIVDELDKGMVKWEGLNRELKYFGIRFDEITTRLSVAGWDWAKSVGAAAGALLTGNSALASSLMKSSSMLADSMGATHDALVQQKLMGRNLSPNGKMGGGFQPFPFRNLAGEAGVDGEAGGEDGKAFAGINSINGGGKSVRNIHVNVEKLVEDITIKTSETLQELPDIERMIEEALVRVVTGAEISISNG